MRPPAFAAFRDFIVLFPLYESKKLLYNTLYHIGRWVLCTA